MSEKQNSLTYEDYREESRREYRRSVKRMRGIERQMRETAALLKETDRIVKEIGRKQEKTQKEIGDLGSRIGDIIEYIVGGGIVKQFQTINIAIKSHSRDKTFGIRDTDESGQIDVFLENGDLVVLIEVKTKLTDDDVREHIEQLEKYRLYGDDKRRIIGAVAAGVVSDNVIKFAHRQGLYVIVQSGEAVEIVTPPKGFKAKEW
jgi:hypothetical protein